MDIINASYISEDSLNSEVYKLDPEKYNNACAIRVSRALNYSGIDVPYISSQTIKGGDGKNYFLGAANLNAWMLKTFENAPTHLTGTQGGKYGQNFPYLLSNKKGIYIMIPNYPGKNYFNASGHADLLTNGSCLGDCYFNPKGAVAYINLWELQ